MFMGLFKRSQYSDEMDEVIDLGDCVTDYHVKLWMVMGDDEVCCDEPEPEKTPQRRLYNRERGRQLTQTHTEWFYIYK